MAYAIHKMPSQLFNAHEQEMHRKYFFFNKENIYTQIKIFCYLFVLHGALWNLKRNKTLHWA